MGVGARWHGVGTGRRRGIRGGAALAWILLAGAGPAAAQTAAAPWQDPGLPFAARAADLAGRLTLEEKVSQMVDVAAAIPRLGIPSYNWGNEALHGVARAGIS